MKKNCLNCNLWKSHFMSDMGDCGVEREFPYSSLPNYTRYNYYCKDWQNQIIVTNGKK